MRSFGSSIATLLALLGAALFATSAMAAKPPCGLSGVTSASIGNYNPFTGSGFANVPVTLNLTRISNGGDKTQVSDFYVVKPPGAQYANFDVVDPNNGNASVMHLDGTQTLSVSGPTAGTVYNNWGGNAQPDTVAFPLVVTVPGGLDLTATQNLQFDIRYICNGTGQLGDITSPTILSNAITIQVHVLAALRAHYAGTPLSFGDLTYVTTGGQQTLGTNHITVQSSSPYTVTISSDNAANSKPFSMMWDSAHTAAADTIAYSVQFLGQTLDSTHTALTGSPLMCQKATLTGVNLPIVATLQEGGSTKTVASYHDYLTVTFSPKDITPQGATCDTL